ncbi:DNA polymerase-3 subunit epsilon [Flavobacterium sp. PL11]|jgi:DNA polymerase-3 subunit epsilon|uniref:3'-5' exonuclease n=1 Tax=Flavobacterium sp. PL11 TaxID=3071717 RepID=UPI002E07347C|nr:DNA polymerase-3 subunit epsilon [Flavobacterium sp. PL11]
MLDWLKNIHKEYPEFWKNYISKFEEKSNRYVIISTQTSGSSTQKDVVLSIAAFTISNDSILIGDNFETVILQYKYFHDNDLMHEFMVESKIKKLSEPEALESFITFISNSVLVGHKINSDVEFINVALDRLNCGRLKNEALDIDTMHRKFNDIIDKEFTLDELCDIYKIPNFDSNSTAENAYKTALLFLKLKSRLKIK